jgi:hypothetical protein
MKNTNFFVDITILPRVSIIALFSILLLISPVFAEKSITDDGKILVTNGSTWVKIDPISDHIVGDTFNLTGTTNFPVLSPLQGTLWTFFQCHMKSCSQDAIDSHGNLSSGEVHPDGITNQFSLQFETNKFISSDDFVFDLYLPLINDQISTHVLMFPSESRKTIKSLISSVSSDDRYWLLIDPLNSTSKPRWEKPVKNSNFQVTGLTNLPEGERIPYSILSSDGFFPPNSTDQVITFAGNKGEVVKGEKIGINKFIVDVNVSRVCDGRSYWVVIWNPRYNTTLSDDFMSTSMNFQCKEQSLNSSKIISTVPSSESAVIPTATKSSISCMGVCLSLILAGIFYFRIRI